MGVCSSAGAKVQHSDDGIEAGLTQMSERTIAIEQHIENLESDITELTTKIQQLEENSTNKDEQIASLKKELVNVKQKLEKDVTAIRTDFNDLQSELLRNPSLTSITVHQAGSVNIADTANHAKTMNNYTASDMLVENSKIQTVDTKEKHISINENTKPRRENSTQIPRPRPDWKPFL